MKSKILRISLFTMTCLYGILAAIIILICWLGFGEALFGIEISLIVLVIQFLISPWITDLSMKWLYKAKFNEGVPEYLDSFIKEICDKYKFKYPKIGIIHDGAPNAFTYGRTKNDARIVITDGLYTLLTEDEVKAVVGHELGHIVHLDMIFMTACQAVPLILYVIYEMTVDNKDNDKDSGKAAIVGYIAYVLYIISQYIILWLSRQREYYADFFSCEETKNPNSLASSLVKIGFGLSTTNSKVSKGNALGIFDAKSSKSLVVTSMDDNGVNKDKIKNAMKWEMWNPWAKWYEFNSTHPLISQRLLKISKISSKYNQDPYITFDLKKPESYADDFARDLFLLVLPYIIIILGIIAFIVFPSKRIIGIFILLFIIANYILFKRKHNGNDFTKTNVSNLLGEVKVSGVTGISCSLEGDIIGRGDPGCIFNEDFVVKDETGFIFADYNQPLFLLNKIFAIFKNKNNMNKHCIVKGWYRRSPVPYIEIYEFEIDGKTKKVFTYGLTKALYIIFTILVIIFTII